MSAHDDMANVNSNIRLTVAIQDKLKSQNRPVPGIYNTVRFGKRVDDSIKLATYLKDCRQCNDDQKKPHNDYHVRRSQSLPTNYNAKANTQ